MTLKYFKGRVGNLVSDGKTKVKFVTEVFATEEQKEIVLLRSSKNTVEIEADEAKRLLPNVFGEVEQGEEQDKVDSDAGDKDNEVESVVDAVDPEIPEGVTRKELEERAEKLGVSKKVLKKAKSNAEVLELIKVAEGDEK